MSFLGPLITSWEWKMISIWSVEDLLPSYFLAELASTMYLLQAINGNQDVMELKAPGPLVVLGYSRLS